MISKIIIVTSLFDARNAAAGLSQDAGKRKEFARETRETYEKKKEIFFRLFCVFRGQNYGEDGS